MKTTNTTWKSAFCMATIWSVPAFAQTPTYKISTVLGGPSSPPASISSVYGIALDAMGNLYYTNTNNSRIGELTTAGKAMTIAGSDPPFGSSSTSSGDGGPATQALLNEPQGVALDSSGNVYIADTLNNKIRMISVAGTITTFGGNGTNLLGAGDGGPATSASVPSPWGIAVDPAGNVYVSGSRTVRKINLAGTISSLNSPDNMSRGDGGLVANAAFVTPTGFAFDRAGNLYIADRDDNRIRKVTPAGIITTIAGNDNPGYYGDGALAIYSGLYQPTGVAVDSTNNVYIADSGNHRVRMLTTDGIINTIAGTGTPGYAGDGGAAVNAQLNLPASIAIGNNGVVFVGDLSGVIRTLVPAQFSPNRPVIRPFGVQSAGAFGGSYSMAPGSFIEIYGSNLAADSRSWASSDFNGPNAPTSLDGTSVSIGGVKAFVSYISPGQINAQVPSNVPIGSPTLTVTTGSGTSDPYTVTVASAAPGWLAPASLKVFGKQYAAALFSDGATFALPPNAIAGVPSRRAEIGDTLTLYGIGFGPVGPDSPAGQVVSQSNGLLSPFQIIFDSLYPGKVLYAGLAPGLIGLYQFNVVVPNTFASDSTQISFTLGGYTSEQTLYIAVGN